MVGIANPVLGTAAPLPAKATMDGSMSRPITSPAVDAASSSVTIPVPLPTSSTRLARSRLAAGRGAAGWPASSLPAGCTARPTPQGSSRLPSTPSNAGAWYLSGNPAEAAPTPPVGRIYGRPAGRGRQKRAAQVSPACYFRIDS